MVVGQMTDIHIDIISDVMCPWCFIGKKRFEKALAELDPAIGITIQWRPFQLDPTLPAEGKDRDTYLAEKFGGLDRAKTLYRNIEEAGAMEGIPFRFDVIKVSPNTLDAHRLIRWAQNAGEGVQARVVDRLLRCISWRGRISPTTVFSSASPANAEWTRRSSKRFSQVVPTGRRLSRRSRLLSRWA
jgi:predicted DsbA family dithiol-disulfide isomerase